MGVATIVTRRLELVSLSPAFLEELLEDRGEGAEAVGNLGLPDGWPDAHDARFLRLRAEQMRAEPAVQQWLVRALVLRGGERAMVGHAGFHGPPGVNAVARPDAVELGYSVFEPFRGRGYAGEAVQGLIDWARAERGIRHFVASVAPGNAPSLAIVRKLGFVETGRHWDEDDGLELEFQLET